MKNIYIHQIVWPIFYLNELKLMLRLRVLTCKFIKHNLMDFKMLPFNSSFLQVSSKVYASVSSCCKFFAYSVDHSEFRTFSQMKPKLFDEETPYSVSGDSLPSLKKIEDFKFFFFHYYPPVQAWRM